MHLELNIERTEGRIDARALELVNADHVQLSDKLRELEIYGRRHGAHRITILAAEADQDILHELGYQLTGAGPTDGNQMSKLLPVLRPARDCDSAALIALITACFEEYEGCVMDVDGEEPWLRAPATAYEQLGGKLWVYALGGFEGPVVACGAVKFGTADLAELKSLYVAAPARRRALAQELTGVIEQAAREAGRSRMHLWSDTRFGNAHQLYRQLGYVQQPDQRELHDKSNTVEMHFERAL